MGLRKRVFESGRLKSPSETVPSIHSNIKNNCPDSAKYKNNKSSGFGKQKKTKHSPKPTHPSCMGQKNKKTSQIQPPFGCNNTSLGEWWIFLHFHRWLLNKKAPKISLTLLRLVSLAASIIVSSTVLFPSKYSAWFCAK